MLLLPVTVSAQLSSLSAHNHRWKTLLEVMAPFTFVIKT